MLVDSKYLQYIQYAACICSVQLKVCTHHTINLHAVHTICILHNMQCTVGSMHMTDDGEADCSH